MVFVANVGIVDVVQRSVRSFQLLTGHLGGGFAHETPVSYVSGPGSLLKAPKILLSLLEVD